MGYAQDLVNKGYAGYQGWGDAEAAADFKATNGQGKGGPASSVSSGVPGVSSVVDTAKQLQQFNIEANKPLVNSLQSSIPEVQGIYGQKQSYLEGQKPQLQQRYDQLLKDVTKKTEIATAREFGRRGISTESGLYDTTLAEKISPEAERLGLSRESDIANINNLIAQLGGQQSTDLRAIQNAIAQALTGAPSESLSGALNLSQQAQNQQQFDVTANLRRQELEQSQQGDPYARFTALGEGQTLYDLLSGQSLYTAPKTYKPETSDLNDWE